MYNTYLYWEDQQMLFYSRSPFLKEIPWLHKVWVNYSQEGDQVCAYASLLCLHLPLICLVYIIQDAEKGTLLQQRQPTHNHRQNDKPKQINHWHLRYDSVLILYEATEMIKKSYKIVKPYLPQPSQRVQQCLQVPSWQCMLRSLHSYLESPSLPPHVCQNHPLKTSEADCHVSKNQISWTYYFYITRSAVALNQSILYGDYNYIKKKYLKCCGP